MACFVTKGVSVIGISTAVPSNTVKSDDFIKKFGEDVVERFKKNTGILKTHRVSIYQTASDLGYAASEYLLKQKQIDRKDIGILVFLSQSPDYRKPATACILQHRLGISTSCAAFDVNLGCSGFVYGHQIMQSMLKSTNSKFGLLIVGDTATKLLNLEDQGTAMMFGDAASAILYQNDGCELSTTLLKTDGSRFKSLIVPSGGFRDLKPENKFYVDREGKVRSKFENYMDGLGVFAFSITDVPKAIEEYLSITNMDIKDFDSVILHQANAMIVKQIARRIKCDIKKVPHSLPEYGNTGGVSIPLTICDTFFKENDSELLLLTVGYGIGLSLGVTSFNINTNDIFPIIETDEVYTDGIFL